MPKIRLPGPLTLGLAGGIPVATQGIMDVLKLREQQRHAQALESFQNRALLMREEEATRRKALRAAAPEALAGLQRGLGALQVEYNPSILPTPGATFTGADITDVLAGMPGAAGSLLPPATPEGPLTLPAQAGAPPTWKRPSPYTALGPEGAGHLAKLLELGEGYGTVAGQMLSTADAALKEQEQRQRIAESNRMMGEARGLLQKDPVAAVALMFRAVGARGVPVSEQMILDAHAHDPQAAEEDMARMQPYLERAFAGDPKAVYDLVALSHTSRSAVGPLFADVSKKLMAQTPGMPWFNDYSDKVRAAQAQKPPGEVLSDEEKYRIAESLAQTPGGRAGFSNALRSSEVFKAMVDRVLSSQKTKMEAKAKEEGRRLGEPPEERQVTTDLKKAQAEALRAKTRVKEASDMELTQMLDRFNRSVIATERSYSTDPEDVAYLETLKAARETIMREIRRRQQEKGMAAPAPEPRERTPEQAKARMSQLRRQGLSRDAAIKQMQQEGY